MVEVFWGITGRGGYIDVVPSEEAVMISAGSLWRGNGFKKKQRWPWKRWMLDSGGYLCLSRFKEYPWTLDDYLKLIRELKPTFAASMDYCCEPSLSLNTEMSVEDRVRASADMANYLCKKSDCVFPVIQGVEFDDYYLSWKLTESLRPKLVGIGSVCRRQNLGEIAHLCEFLGSIIPEGVMRHGFGVKMLAMKKNECRKFFTSIDTNAWEFWRRAEKWSGRRWTLKESWDIYSSKLRTLCEIPVKPQPRSFFLSDMNANK